MLGVLLEAADVDDDEVDDVVELAVVANPSSQFQPNARVASGLSREITSVTSNRRDAMVFCNTARDC